MLRPAQLLVVALVATNTQALELELPVAPGDSGYLAFGVAPFGYHVAEHRFDGHPGFDIEFIPGRKVHAAHGGIVKYTTDPRDPLLKTVSIEFVDGGINYQTFYTNIADLEPGIVNGATVATGEVFGTPASVVRDMGNAGSFTYAMTHFQLADNRINYGLSNQSALSPENYFSNAARSALYEIWDKSQYHQMICEPFLSSARGAIPYPVITRRWKQSAGSSVAAEIEFTCDYSQSDSNSAYTYRLKDADETPTETGTAVVTAVVAGVSLIDLIPVNGLMRKGVLYTKDGSMRLDYSAPGGNRPPDLLNAIDYATEPAVSCAKSTDAICFSENRSPFDTGDGLNVNISLDWAKLSDAASAVDLWYALALPTGQLLFGNDAGAFQEAPSPFMVNVSTATRRMTLLDAVIPQDLAPGSYQLYVALATADSDIDTLERSLRSNVASLVLYLKPPTP